MEEIVIVFKMEEKKKLNYKEIKKEVEKHSLKSYMELVKWLYDNHKDVLREWEATRGKLRIEFA